MGQIHTERDVIKHVADTKPSPLHRTVMQQKNLSAKYRNELRKTLFVRLIKKTPKDKKDRSGI